MGNKLTFTYNKEKHEIAKTIDDIDIEIQYLFYHPTIPSFLTIISKKKISKTLLEKLEVLTYSIHS